MYWHPKMLYLFDSIKGITIITTIIIKIGHFDLN